MEEYLALAENDGDAIYFIKGSNRIQLGKGCRNGAEAPANAAPGADMAASGRAGEPHGPLPGEEDGSACAGAKAELEGFGEDAFMEDAETDEAPGLGKAQSRRGWRSCLDDVETSEHVSLAAEESYLMSDGARTMFQLSFTCSSAAAQDGVLKAGFILASGFPRGAVRSSGEGCVCAIGRTLDGETEWSQSISCGAILFWQGRVRAAWDIPFDTSATDSLKLLVLY
jgi:hypothetical protein